MNSSCNYRKELRMDIRSIIFLSQKRPNNTKRSVVSFYAFFLPLCLGSPRLTLIVRNERIVDIARIAVFPQKPPMALHCLVLHSIWHFFYAIAFFSLWPLSLEIFGARFIHTWPLYLFMRWERSLRCNRGNSMCLRLTVTWEEPSERISWMKWNIPRRWKCNFSRSQVIFNKFSKYS